jgi:hypothetical protein
MRLRIKIIFILCALPFLWLVGYMKAHPAWTESYFSRGLYPYISKVQNFLFNWTQWSLGDLAYLFLLAYVVYWIIFKMRYVRLKEWLLNLGVSVFLIYFFFHFIWGFNYYREPIAMQMKLGDSCQVDDLIKVTNHLASATNTVHLRITKNDSVAVKHTLSIAELADSLKPGFIFMNAQFNTGSLGTKKTKASLLSQPLSYMGFSGYLNPFTLEAQVNDLVPSYSIAATIAHEQAHQLGFAAENEANFIGALACYYSDDSYVRYSGLVMALRICLNELFKLNPDEYTNILRQLNYGVLLNFEESRQFWIGYNNPFEKYFKKGYNQYLKSNAQKKGLESYNEAVVLIVNFFKTKLN